MATYPIDFGGTDLTVNTISVGATGPGKSGTNIQTSITENSITLAAGTATVAPLNLTAGTNLTTATAGSVEFDGAAFYATSIASARQQLDSEQFVIASANSATYNNTLLDTAVAAPVFTTTTSGTAAGAITLTAGKTYAFEAQYLLTNTGTTSHTWATLFAGTATLTSIAYSAFGLSTTTANTPATGGLSGFSNVATATVVTAASTSATEQVIVTLNGVLTVNAGGTFIPQMKASARPGATGTPGVILNAGSFFRIWQMGSANSVGNWS